MDSFNNMGEKVTVGLGYRFIGQRRSDAHFTLVDINPVNRKAKLLAIKSKNIVWVDVDSLVLMNTSGNRKKAEILNHEPAGLYLKGLIGKEHYESWIERMEATQ